MSFSFDRMHEQKAAEEYQSLLCAFRDSELQAVCSSAHLEAVPSTCEVES